MAMIFVRSVSGSNVTLSDNTVVGAVPVLVNTDSAACQSGISQGQIVEVSKEIGELLLGLSRITSQTQLAGRNQTLIQTHNAVSIPASSYSLSNWQDVKGFDKVALSLKNDAAVNSKIQVQWSHDGVNMVANDGDTLTATTNDTPPSVVIDVKARYVKIALFNQDTVAHTMSSWLYLKS